MTDLPSSDSPPSSLNERRSSPAHLLIAALLSAEVVAVGDVILSAQRSSTPVPQPSLLASIYAAVGLYIGPAFIVGALLFWIADSALKIFGGDAFFRIRRAVREPQSDAVIAAALLAGLGVLLFDAGLLYYYVRAIGFEMANRRNGALTSAMVAVGALPLLALLGLPLYRITRRVVGLMPRPRLLFTTVALLAFLLIGVALALLSVDWRIIHFGPAKAFGCFLALLGLLGWLFSRLWSAPNRVRDGVLLLLFLGSGLLGLAHAMRRFGDDPRARALISEETAGASFLLKRTRALFDRDGDGYASRLGGGDCDDRSADVHPGAEDLPGNGRDEDCDGQDEPLPTADVKSLVPSTSGAPAAPGAMGAAKKALWDGNFLIITVDTLRSDRVKQETAPNLTQLAARGTRFTNVYAQAPNTPRSFPSFITSRLPSEVHFVNKLWNFSPLTGKDETMFSVLAAAGVKNYGVFSHFYLENKTHLHTGFTDWNNSGAKNLHDSNSDIAAPRVTQAVIDRLKQLGADKSRFALWTHLFDPHSTYMDHAEYPVPKGFKYLAQRYDAEVQFTDKHIGLILGALRDSGLSERTAVVVFSDHGEAFGEHKLNGEQLYFHGEALYNEVLRVPLIVYVPGRAPQVIDERVTLLDIAPTVLELSGITPPASFSGRSLVPLLTGTAVAGAKVPPAIAEMLPCTAWPKNERVIVDTIDGVDYALYAKYTDNLNELYNLRDDPTQQKNLIGSQPDKAKELARRLSAALRPRR